MEAKPTYSTSYHHIKETEAVQNGGLMASRILVEDQGREIELRVSRLTGYQSVRVNGEVISKKRSYSQFNKHFFTHEGNEYEVELVHISYLKNSYICSVFRNNILLNEIECNMVSPVEGRTVMNSFSLMFVLVVASILVGVLSIIPALALTGGFLAYTAIKENREYLIRNLELCPSYKENGPSGATERPAWTFK